METDWDRRLESRVQHLETELGVLRDALQRIFGELEGIRENMRGTHRSSFQEISSSPSIGPGLFPDHYPLDDEADVCVPCREEKQSSG